MSGKLDLQAVMAANTPHDNDNPAGTSGEWTEIRRIIEQHVLNQPRGLQKEIGPSELGTDCLHCLAARLAGWERHQTVAWLPFIGTCVHARFEQLFDKNNEQVVEHVRHRSA